MPRRNSNKAASCPNIPTACHSYIWATIGTDSNRNSKPDTLHPALWEQIIIANTYKQVESSRTTGCK
jgi:hypothetical protein